MAGYPLKLVSMRASRSQMRATKVLLSEQRAMIPPSVPVVGTALSPA